MPFYKIAEIQQNPSTANPQQFVQGAVGGPAVFFTVKSPAGDGDLDQDYNRAEGAEEAEKRFEEAKKQTPYTSLTATFSGSGK